MKVKQAEEFEDVLQVVVEFPDGYTQTVQLPNWATKQNIKDEAQRLRKKQDDKEASRKPRTDLED